MRILILSLILAAAGAAPGNAAPHTVAEGEHMWSLAERYYKDSSRWRVIAEANKQVQDPHWIYPGQILEIPALSTLEKAAAEAVEASASFRVVPQEAPPEPAAAPEAVAAPAPAAVKPRKKETTSSDGAGLQDASGDGLSLDMAPAMTGYYFSHPRLKASAGWRRNGDVIGEGDSLGTVGERIDARFDSRLPAVKPGERFTIYRHSGVRDTDLDQNALYIQKVGMAEAAERLPDGKHRLIIIESADSVQPGDWLKKEK